MYAALIPDTIRPIIVPIAQRNILRSPSRVPEIFRAFRKHHTAAAKAEAEMVPKTIERMRSRLSTIWPGLMLRRGVLQLKYTKSGAKIVGQYPRSYLEVTPRRKVAKPQGEVDGMKVT